MKELVEIPETVSLFELAVMEPVIDVVEFWKNYNAGSLKWRTHEDSFSRRYNDGEVEIYHDFYADTVVVDLNGNCILDTRSPFNAASADVYPGTAIYPKTNSGYDYEARRNPNEQVPSIQ